MTRALPPFFAELGIEDADSALDERTLRRAYARRLKRIDIEAEPQRFQDLREALEAALRWSAARDRDAESEPPDVAANDDSDNAASEASSAADAPEALADAVFAIFQPQVTTFLDRALAHDAVQHALADPRLVSIDARTFFEWRIARLLAEGWQPGHQHLLAPAIEAFAWEGDHARLSNFGQVGALLEAAIRDIAVTEGFTEAQKVAIAPLLERIRAAVPPDADTLADDIAALQFLVQRVPNWLRLVSPVEPVNERFQRWRDRPTPAPAPAPPQFATQRPPAPRKTNSGIGAVAVVMAVIMFLLSQISRLDEPSAKPGAPQAVHLTAEGLRELEQRQREVDELLKGIRHPTSPRLPAKPTTAFPAADPFTRVPPAKPGQYWYAPNLATDPYSTGGTTPPN